MTNHQLEHELHQVFQMAEEPAPQALLDLARQEAQRRGQRIGFWKFLLLQIRFLGWKIWAAQGAALLVVCLWLSRSFGQELWSRPQSVAGLLLCLSVLTVMSAPPLLYRSVRCRMQEVEAASRFSSNRLLMARLLIIGLGDGAMLGGILLTAALGSALSPGTAALLVCLPFLLCAGGCLYLLGHVPPRQFLTGSLGLCGTLLGALLLLNRHGLLGQRFFPGWGLLCLGLLGFCIHQLRFLGGQSAYTEMQIV